MPKRSNVYRIATFVLLMSCLDGSISARNPFQQDSVVETEHKARELVGQLQTQSGIWRVYRTGSLYQIETNDVH